MNFDILSSIELTACAAIVVSTFITLFGKTGGERSLIGGAFALWFVGVVWAGAWGLLGPRGFGTPALGAAVSLPVILLGAIGFGFAGNRRRLRDVPASILVGVHAIRVLGVSFVLLYAAHRLPAPFAPVAGWGDIAIGATALPLALWMARDPRKAQTALFIWNILGLLDLVTAIALGATSSPGPIRLFFQPPGAAIMTTLPWIIIPCFLVPALAFLHLVTFDQLAQERRDGNTAENAALPVQRAAPGGRQIA
jgi:uncharacterized membrane protein